MKSMFKVSLLAATVMFAVGCQKEEEPKVETAPAVEQVAEAGKTVTLKRMTIERLTLLVFHLQNT